jgi:hypothetical protein
LRGHQRDIAPVADVGGVDETASVKSHEPRYAVDVEFATDLNFAHSVEFLEGRLEFQGRGFHVEDISRENDA